MFRLDYPEYVDGQFSIFEASLNPGEVTLPDDLKKADEALGDPKFEEPFIKKFDINIGRAGIPIRPYTRLMYLKYINSWGYETLVQQVSESMVLRRFCRIPIDTPVPHSTTLIRLNKKYGDSSIKRIFNAVDHRINKGSHLLDFIRSAVAAVKRVVSDKKR
ncbi:MAG: transposase [Eubacteriales bacterium]|nr:transposase [Eubacteriales bacterium]